MRRLLFGAIVSAIWVAQMPALAQTAALPPEVASAGVTEAQWDAVRDEVRRQAGRARVSERALQAAAAATGTRFAASGRFNALTLLQAVVDALDQQAEQIADLNAQLDRLTGDTDPEVARLFAQARAALDAGLLNQADRLLSEVSSRDLSGLQAADAEAARLRLRAAATIAARANVAYLRADYRAAADLFARSAGTAPESARMERWWSYMGQANMLLTQGDRFEFTALQEARSVLLTRALPLAPRSTSAREWAITQHDLGRAFEETAERQTGASALDSLFAP